MSSNSGLSRDLWMGGIFKPYMTESFIINAFQKMGEKPVSVKFNKKKKPGEPPGCCFVQFQNEEDAKKALNELNGKIIPNSVPPMRFLLNMVGPGVKLHIPKYSVWLTDLSPDVDDSSLLKTFSARYQSVVQAKVILDIIGCSKGIAHLKFANEDDQRHCLKNMNGFKGLGSRTLRVSATLPQTLWHPASSGSTDLMTQYERSYWQNYAVWQNSFRDAVHSNFAAELTTLNIIDSAVQKEDELDLIEHNTKLDVDTWNRDMIQRDYNMWDAMECSKWLPLHMTDQLSHQLHSSSIEG